MKGTDILKDGDSINDGGGLLEQTPQKPKYPGGGMGLYPQYYHLQTILMEISIPI